MVRIATGFVSLWAFLDKTFGLGYATPGERAWINGGSPTKGFLGNLDHGPFAAMFRGWAGAGWTDWLFMLALAAIGIAVILGIGLRIAAVSGTLLMLLMWTAEWPLDRLTDTGEPRPRQEESLAALTDCHDIRSVLLVTRGGQQSHVRAIAGTTWHARRG